MIKIKSIKAKISGANKEFYGITAFYDNVFAGFCTLNYFDSKVPNICNVAVDKDFRRLGVATKLVRECIKLCKKKKAVNLWVDKKNYGAIRLYEDLGFKICSDEDPMWMTYSIRK